MNKLLFSVTATTIFLAFVAVVVWGASFRLNLYGDAMFAGPQTEQSAPALTTTKFWHNLQRWDAGWYRQIVTEGYTTQSVAFFPLYPMTLKAVMWFLPTSNNAFPNAAFLISVLCLLGIVYLLMVLAKLEQVPEPRLAVVLFLLFPTSFFLAAPYSEALCILLLLGYIVAIKQQKWFIAVLVGILLGATRVNAIAAAVVPTYFLIQAWRNGERNQKTISTWVLVAAAPAVGLVLYMGYLQWYFGDALAFLHAQAKWGRVNTFSLVNLYYTAVRDWVDMTGVSAFHPRFTVGFLNYAFTAVGIGASVWLWLHKYRAYAWLALAFMAIPLATGTVSSIPRLILPVMPLVAVVLAKKIKNPLWLSFFVVTNAVLWTFLLMLFTRQYWVA